ncbi:tRNA N6-adenosine threonylcarbamoyltransferase [Geobacter sp. OR-1]|uniref:tRNA (adenosine(37)-N6)-threonylcarbamoyltransferase complex transferase subunit TsaD n=1 Tax=Geobacter sp. OR-1 TaxID=1266765 RepID=UPI000542F1D2|nr:tRNA (adenosine(37)-N6)-threonylcarbamoyltransferase complex transferase subunit TsaD [Geobacter sp. OR-1]GAM07758.1 tRNA N6-adenosine threonylcarbamoyltransferase [Geobacter sp. OR-1]
MLVLAIETSCDETAAAVVRDGRTVLSSIVASQVAIHAEYGGVVPEIASRRHLESIVPVVEEALSASGVSLSEINGVAVTQGPGLVGALLVGIAAARGIGAAMSIPVTGVNHIEAHLLAAFLEQEIEFPYLALVVSGGHTHLYRVEGVGRYSILGQTIDDAAGEAFDKVAKIVGLTYPGGALIDRLAASGDPKGVKLPRPLLHDGSCNFSFSGLKTAVLNWVQKNPDGKSGQPLQDLCASFQSAVCEVLAFKTAMALERTGIRRLVVAGGVACNSGLRREISVLAASRGVELYIPAPALCADNAAMVAVPGEYYLSERVATINGFDALPSWPLDRIKARFAERA